ncbi:hypothetical protein NUSPORA_00475 [Nucleospora cyclopteri]
MICCLFLKKIRTENLWEKLYEDPSYRKEFNNTDSIPSYMVFLIIVIISLFPPDHKLIYPSRMIGILVFPYIFNHYNWESVLTLNERIPHIVGTIILLLLLFLSSLIYLGKKSIFNYLYLSIAGTYSFLTIFFSKSKPSDNSILTTLLGICCSFMFSLFFDFIHSFIMQSLIGAYFLFTLSCMVLFLVGIKYFRIGAGGVLEGAGYFCCLSFIITAKVALHTRINHKKDLNNTFEY